MRIVLQRVSRAAVSVGGRTVTAINRGYLLLVGVEIGDDEICAEKLSSKVAKLRVFEDSRGKMNLNIKDVSGEVLSVPQFTLLGSVDKGNRPGFDRAASPEEAKTLWRIFNKSLRDKGIHTAEGVFGENMGVSLTNDGPVTFVLEGTC